jgi:hypothetical protein
MELLDHALAAIDHSIRSNRREDGTYHAYNLLDLKGDEAGVDPDDKLEEGDAVRALASERDHLRDLVDAVREELGLLDVHDDAEVLRELAALKALRVPA